MRRIIVMAIAGVCLLIGVLAASLKLDPIVTAQETRKGEWVGRVRERDGRSKLWVQIYENRESKDGREHYSQMSFDLDVQELSGFNSTSTSQFTLKREAGTIVFDGLFKDGKGIGDYTFTPNAGFVAAMNSLGYSDLKPEKLFSMTIFNVTTGFINEMKSIGYTNIPQDKLISMRIFKVDKDFVRDVESWGFEKQSLDKLISMRVHRLDGNFIKEVEAMGFSKLSLDKLMSMRIHRVDAKFVNEMKGLGFQNLTVDELIRMRIHGVDSNFIRKMKGNQ
ncbi:MAG TPA: hypothetical protein VEF04_03920 [Blastocatellia bacterium]|nr:hypothetical protein [Blastocatellia bacterium]